MKQPAYWRFGILASFILSSLACNLTGQPSGKTPVPPADKQPANQPVVVDPTQPTDPTLTPTGTPQPNAYFKGISFLYDPSLAAGVTAQTHPASIPSGEQEPLFAINPTIDQFDFQGYVITQGLDPVVQVFPVNEYETMGGEQVTAVVDSLKKILVNRPKESSGRLPFLPFNGAGELFHAQLSYVKFQNGEGIRYLTEYGQDVGPLSNNLLFYTFQGLTSDGEYYVSAVLPVNHAAIPGDSGEELKAQDYAKFVENYPAYIVDIQQKLNDESGDSFTPKLDLFDSMIMGLKIEK